MCIDAATTSYYFGDVPPLFLDSINAEMGPVNFLFCPALLNFLFYLHCFLGHHHLCFSMGTMLGSGRLIAGDYLS